MQMPGLCPGKRNLVGLCKAWEGAEPPSSFWTAKNEMSWLTKLKPFPHQGEEKSLQVLAWMTCLKPGHGKVILCHSPYCSSDNA